MAAREQLIDDDVTRICQRVLAIVSSQQLEGRRILLTGASGFLGRWFQRTTAEFNRIIGIRNREPIQLLGWDTGIASEDYRAPDTYIRFERVDAASSELLSVPESLDLIIHAAGIASPPRYLSHPLETVTAAVDGTRNMLELARQKKARLLFFSSSEAYGDPDPGHVPTAEDYRGNVAMDGPRAVYDESKRMGETLCDVYSRHFGVETVRVRPFNVYGPEMQVGDRRMIPNLIQAGVENSSFTVYGDGSARRTFCYVQDAMVGFWLALLKGRPGEAYNIGTSVPELSVNSMAALFKEHICPELEIRHIETPSFDQGNPTRRCPDISKAHLELSYQPQIPLIEGLRRTYGAAVIPLPA